MFIELTQVNPNPLCAYADEGPVTLNIRRILSVRIAPKNEKGIHSVVNYLGSGGLHIFRVAETKETIDEMLGTRINQNITRPRPWYADN